MMLEVDVGVGVCLLLCLHPQCRPVLLVFCLVHSAWCPVKMLSAVYPPNGCQNNITTTTQAQASGSSSQASQLQLHPLHSIFSPLHPLECCSCALARLGGSGHGHSSGGQSFHLQMLIMRLHSLRISQYILMSHSLMGWRAIDVSHNSDSLLTSLVTCSA